MNSFVQDLVSHVQITLTQTPTKVCMNHICHLMLPSPQHVFYQRKKKKKEKDLNISYLICFKLALTRLKIQVLFK